MALPHCAVVSLPCVIVVFPDHTYLYFFIIANSADPDVMPHFVAYHLGIHILLMSHF